LGLVWNWNGVTTPTVYCVSFDLGVLKEYNLQTVIPTLRAADQKYMESFEMWCWRRIEKISSTDHVRNEEVLLRINEQRNNLY
jgi:hypothetical protein